MDSIINRYKIAVVSLPISVLVAVILFLLGGHHAAVIARSFVVVGLVLTVFSLAKGKKNQNSSGA